MKKQLIGLGISVLLITGVAFTALPQHDKNKNNKKEQQQNPGKGHGKPGNAGNNNNGKNDKVKQNQGKKEEKQNNDNGRNKDKMEKNQDHGKNDGKGNNDDNINHPNKDGKHGYDWNHETFKDRKKIKNQEKVTICHKFNSDQPAVTITVSSNALKAHMAHGDVMGTCPALKSTRYSDKFLRERNDYYNRLAEAQEEVLYSRSILDYALARLASSRSQLALLQRNNMPVVEIQRKQATVVELEQNVSLLETLIGVAVNLLVNKL